MACNSSRRAPRFKVKRRSAALCALRVWGANRLGRKASHEERVSKGKIREWGFGFRNSLLATRHLGRCSAAALQKCSQTKKGARRRPFCWSI